MYTAALFITVPNGKQYPSTDKWLIKMIYSLNRLLSNSTRKESNTACYSLDRPWKHTKGRNPVIKNDVILYNAQNWQAMEAESRFTVA